MAKAKPAKVAKVLTADQKQRRAIAFIRQMGGAQEAKKAIVGVERIVKLATR